MTTGVPGDVPLIWVAAGGVAAAVARAVGSFPASPQAHNVTAIAPISATGQRLGGCGMRARRF
jgi:hypothetical protein